MKEKLIKGIIMVCLFCVLIGTLEAFTALFIHIGIINNVELIKVASTNFFARVLLLICTSIALGLFCVAGFGVCVGVAGIYLMLEYLSNTI